MKLYTLAEVLVLLGVPSLAPAGFHPHNSAVETPTKKATFQPDETGWDVAKNSKKLRTVRTEPSDETASGGSRSEIELQRELHASRIINRSQNPSQIGIIDVPASRVKP